MFSAPDYRAGTPYQAPLAEALSFQSVEVTFLSDYRRGQFNPELPRRTGLPSALLRKSRPPAWAN